MIINRIIAVVFLLGCIISASAQEITRIEYIPNFVVGNVNTSVSHDDRIIEDHGRYYLNFHFVDNEADQRDWGLDVDFSNRPEWHGNPNSEPRNSLLMEYKPDEGFVDYTLFNYGSTLGIQKLAVDGDHLAIGMYTKIMGLDNKLLYPDTSQMARDSVFGGDFLVYDKLNDTILWHLKDESDIQMRWECVGLHDDHLYVATTFDVEQPFMGDTLRHMYPDSFGIIQYSTILHKINWRTNEIKRAKKLRKMYYDDKEKS